MTTTLSRLPSTPAGLAAAALLPRRHLHLRLDADAALPPGFAWGPTSIDLWTPTDDESSEATSDALERWVSGGVELSITDVASFGVEALVERIYFPLFVRWSYCLGDADYPVNAETLRRLATPDVVLTMALREDRPVAAALLQPARRTPSERYDAPELVEDGADLVVLATSDAGAAEPFFRASLQMLEANGYAYVRTRRSPWITLERAAFWLRDLERATRLACETRAPGDAFAWRDAALEGDEALLAFRLDGATLRTTIHGKAPLLDRCQARIEALRAP